MTAAPTVGVVTVATNRYVEYWKQLAESVDQYLFPGHEVTMHVFTDRVDQVFAFAPTLKRIRVKAVAIDALTWPEATLLRYEVFDSHREQLVQDVLVHLDADMLIAEHGRTASALFDIPATDAQPGAHEGLSTPATPASPSATSTPRHDSAGSAVGRPMRPHAHTCRETPARPMCAVAPGSAAAIRSSRWSMSSPKTPARISTEERSRSGTTKAT